MLHGGKEAASHSCNRSVTVEEIPSLPAAHWPTAMELGCRSVLALRCSVLWCQESGAFIRTDKTWSHQHCRATVVLRRVSVSFSLSVACSHLWHQLLSSGAQGCARHTQTRQSIADHEPETTASVDCFSERAAGPWYARAGRRLPGARFRRPTSAWLWLDSPSPVGRSRQSRTSHGE